MGQRNKEKVIPFIRFLPLAPFRSSSLSLRSVVTSLHYGFLFIGNGERNGPLPLRSQWAQRMVVDGRVNASERYVARSLYHLLVNKSWKYITLWPGFFMLRHWLSEMIIKLDQKVA